MMAHELTIYHQGRLTQATAAGGRAQLKRLRHALLLKDFLIVTEQDDALELRRRARLTQDDWPMRVSVRRAGDQIELRYWLYIPWGWIGSFVGLAFLALPFAGIRSEVLMFGLALTAAALAISKQKFDCRPNARFWQQRPRQRWGETMERLLREACA